MARQIDPSHPAELWKCGLLMGNAGRVIVGWFSRWCNHHAITPTVLAPLLDEHPGIGTVEKDEARKARLLREKIEELAMCLWRERGCPPDGHLQFLHEAQQWLLQAIKGSNST